MTANLIEVMISLLLIAIMLLGLDAVHIKSLSDDKNSYYFAVAVQQMENMIERLKATKGNSITTQVEDWNKENQAVLPAGKGTVNGQYPDFTLKVFWGDQGEASCQKNKIRSSGCLIRMISIFN